MDTTIFIGLANQKALRRELDVVAHNVANMNTTAFKKEKVVFRQFLVEAQNAQATEGGKVSYMIDHGVVRNLDQGTYTPTGNSLDVFIDGKGYIAVESESGEVLYTRNGRMELDVDNFLVTFSGEKILDDGGQPIQLSPGATEISIGKDGTFSTAEDGVLGTIGTYTFEQEQGLKRRGNSLYETDQAPEPPEENPVRLIQYALESSNVNGIETLVDMTRIMRAYQAATRNQDQIQKLRTDSLDRLARVQ